ncbi:hypothetical protein BY996DRAFT_4582639 [Phakopsora pachyrhizi]|uniref:Expressed protein n=1 Tax=Phakopsora pachyrhizi TaxID=170000 RepID=A0AAV0AHL7_PHAPC|nr:hypothetical protein BY996DRAFT_4582639 [Phakopsora pachyrhizi]CAH7666528.1 expressed protein [Phakopsora pachyrhizi]
MRKKSRSLLVLCFLFILIGLVLSQEKLEKDAAKKDGKEDGQAARKAKEASEGKEGAASRDIGADKAKDGAADKGKDDAAARGKDGAVAKGKDAQGDDHVIIVGKGGKVFTPPTIDAKVGDTVTFEFHPKAHTVTQSFFEDPCRLASKGEAKGFNSGVTPVKPQTKSSDLPRWTMKIEVVTPIYFYCAAPGHCASGMVGAINAPKTGEKTFAKFQELASASGNGSK